MRLQSKNSISEYALKCMMADIGQSGGHNGGDMHQISLANIKVCSLVLQPITSSHIPQPCSSNTYTSQQPMLSFSSSPTASQHHDLNNDRRQKYEEFSLVHAKLRSSKLRVVVQREAPPTA
jgi:hypothetical protein